MLGIASDEGIIEPDYNLPIEKLSLRVLNFLLFGKLEEDAFLESLNLHTSLNSILNAGPGLARKIFKWAVQNGLGILADKLLEKKYAGFYLDMDSFDLTEPEVLEWAGQSYAKVQELADDDGRANLVQRDRPFFEWLLWKAITQGQVAIALHLLQNISTNPNQPGPGHLSGFTLLEIALERGYSFLAQNMVLLSGNG